MKKKALIAVGYTLILAGCNNETIPWRDRTQKQLIQYLEKYNFPYSEAHVDNSGLIILEAYSSKIKSIYFLENMQLQELVLRSSSVTDLSPLQETRSLIKLDLSKSSVSDLSPLKFLCLERLDISSTNVQSLDGLQNSPLKHLNLANTQISSLENILLDHLEVLNIRNTKITDLSPLVRAKRLRHLYFTPEQLDCPEQIGIIKSISSITTLNYYSDPALFWKELKEKQRLK